MCVSVFEVSMNYLHLQYFSKCGLKESEYCIKYKVSQLQIMSIQTHINAKYVHWMLLSRDLGYTGARL